MSNRTAADLLAMPTNGVIVEGLEPSHSMGPEDSATNRPMPQLRVRVPWRRRPPYGPIFMVHSALALGFMWFHPFAFLELLVTAYMTAAFVANTTTITATRDEILVDDAPLPMPGGLRYQSHLVLGYTVRTWQHTHRIVAVTERGPGVVLLNVMSHDTATFVADVLNAYRAQWLAAPAMTQV